MTAPGRGRPRAKSARSVPPPEGPPPDLGALLEQAPDGIVVLDQEFRILHANARACEMFGYSLDEMRRANVRDLSAPDELRMHPLRPERLRAGRAAVTYRQLRRKDGTVFTAEASGRRTDDGRVVAVLRDITSRPGAEQRLAESERNLARAQELARFGTWEVDLGTYTARWSRELYRIFGLSPDQGPIVFGLFTSCLHPEDRAEVERLVGEAIAGRLPPHTFEFRVVRPDGSVRVLHGTMDTRREPDGRVSRLMGSAQDVTEQRLLELQLREAQKLEAIGRLAGGVAHDFNNLLTVILGFVETMLDGMPTDDPHRAGAEQIRQAGRRAAGLTQQLLAFGRRQMLRPQVFDLNEVLAEMQEILRRLIGERIEVAVCTGARHALIRADRGQIEQVVFNLALNARDAMPSGGRLEIATSDVDGPAGDGGAVGPPAAPCLLLAVSDTGIGIRPEVLPRIFEPFYTTKDVGQGTGLGLPTVHGIVSQSGGRIEVDSTPGEGTRFRVYLPRATDEPAPEPAGPLAPAQGGDEWVLLVEDEPAVRGLVAEVLRGRGYGVLGAADGEAALELAAGHAGSLRLLVTDVVLPGMDGRDLARRLARDRPGLRVLFVSGHDVQGAQADGPPLPPAAFLQKPFSLGVLVRSVRELLDRPA